MRVDLQAQIAKVTAKPPKMVAGFPEGEPHLQIVLEVEGTGHIGDVARFLAQIVAVRIESPQMHFADLSEGAEEAKVTHLAQTR